MESEKDALVSADVLSDKSTYTTNAGGQYGTLVEVEIKGEWKSRWKNVFPTGFMKESREIFRLAWPIYIINLLQYISGPISMIFSGHLGTAELASVAMATSLINISAMSIINGLSTACDTLFAQAFGGDNKKTLGVYLQRSIIILSLSCLPCWAIHLNAYQFLLVLGQDPEVARLTGDYMLIFIPGFLFTVVQQVLAKYLQIQGMLKPLILIGLLANGLNILLQYLLVYVVQMGIYGSSLAQTISFLISLLLTLIYIIVWKKHHATWPGWTWKCLENWGVFIKLSISGLFMILFEWWIYEIGVFLSGLLGTVELTAASTCLQIQTFLYLVSVSLSVAVSIRVGCNLGAGNADGAKTASRVALVLSFSGFVVELILLLSLMSVTPYIFTSDESVANLATSLMPITGLIICSASIVLVIEGTLQGAGRQFIGALVNTPVYAFVVLPIAVVLMFVVKIGPSGFLWGVSIGVLPSTLIYLIILARMNWKAEVDKVGTRILTTDMVISLEVNALDDVFNQRIVLPDRNTSLANGNTSGTMLRRSGSFGKDSYSPQPNPHGSWKEEAGVDDVTYVPETLCYLICKRVAVVLVLLAILLAGIITRVLIPVSEASTNNSTMTNNTDHQMTTVDMFMEI